MLVNVTGGGKTRQILDSLCERWGFYFVVEPDAAGTGSQDLSELMRELDVAQDYRQAKDRLALDARDEKALHHIRETTDRRLTQLLLVRFLLL